MAGDAETMWFSCTIQFAESTDNATLFRYRSSVYLFRAADHEAARRRALQIGRNEERVYRNASGSMFRTALVQVETLDLLGDIEDGLEVAHWSTEHIDPPPFPWDHRYNPEESSFYTTL